jgi:hypothetical protein
MGLIPEETRAECRGSGSKGEGLAEGVGVGVGTGILKGERWDETKSERMFEKVRLGKEAMFGLKAEALGVGVQDSSKLERHRV